MRLSFDNSPVRQLSPSRVGPRPASARASSHDANVQKALRQKLETPPAASVLAQQRFQSLPGGVPDPMLARVWQLYEHAFPADTPFHTSLKLDGVRCIAMRHPTTRRVGFFSRVGNEFQCCPHIAEALQPLFDAHPKLALDGELYRHGMPFGDLVGCVKARPGTATPEHHDLQGQMQFHVFDIARWRAGTMEMPFAERQQQYLQLLEEHLDPEDYCAPPRTVRARLGKQDDTTAVWDATLADFCGRVASSAAAVVPVLHVKMRKAVLEAALHSALEHKLEGVMLRDGAAPYQWGKRSAALMKWKIMHDSEFRIVDVVEGEGRFRGMVGAFVFETADSEKKRFRAGLSAPLEARKSLWGDRKTLIGLQATVQYQELTPAGVPRFPVVKAIRGSGPSDPNWL
jgi:DNA ligase-1